MKRCLLAIVGMPKSGTTALASYLVNHCGVQLLVPGIKEPYLFAEHDYVAPEIVRPLALQPGPSTWLLDASAGYASNPVALDRMYVFDPTVIVCFRNAFERAYSTFRFHKLVASRTAVTERIDERYQFAGTDRLDIVGLIEKLNLLHWPRSARATMAGYLDLEAERVRTSTFLERITYELQFFASRRVWPFRSAMAESFYTYPAKLLLDRFAGKVTFTSVSKISKQGELRDRFLATVLGAGANPGSSTPPIPITFSLADLPLDEEPPDFRSSGFDFVRDAFRYDLGAFDELLAQRGVDRSFLDLDELNRFL